MLSQKETINAKYEHIDFIRGYKHTSKEGNSTVIYFYNGKIEITYFKHDIIKIFIGESFEKSHPTAAVSMSLASIPVDFIEDESNVKVLGSKVDVVIDKQNLQITFLNKSGDVISSDYNPSGRHDKQIFISKINNALAYYGFGEKGGSLNKKGQYIENYNTDDGDNNDNTLLFYKTIPFFIGLNKASCFGYFLDNSFRSYFDMGKSNKDQIFFGAVDGQLQYYFMYSEDIKGVVEAYSSITGTMDMPPMWSLGYQQCRYSYSSEKELLEIADTLRDKNIPCDTLYLDIDHMDGYRVMTFNHNAFPNPQNMLSKLKEKGFKVVTILDPGVKVDDNYPLYQRGIDGDHFVKLKNGVLYTGEVWPGASAFPDFSNEKSSAWWKKELKDFLSLGISGIWNDMNEPGTFDSDERTIPDDAVHNCDSGVMEHSQFHNMYGMQMSRCSKEAQEELHADIRPFSMTRATFAGGQRYSSVWTGDNRSRWEHLRMSISMNANLGMSGFSFVGNDVGGYGEDVSEELFIRWMELGTFLPIFRNHSAIDTRRQEPWAFGKSVEEICKNSIKLRYKLLPYLYNQYYKSYKSGIPVFRPMIMEFPKDMNLLDMYSEFMFGDSLLIAPVLYEGERQKLVYLPEGTWYNYFTKEKYVGGRYYSIQVALSEILVFVKEGTILPVYEEDYNYTGEKDIPVTLKVFKGSGSMTLYEDDGISCDYKIGKYNLYHIEAENASTQHIKIEIINNGLEKVQDFQVKYI